MIRQIEAAVQASGIDVGGIEYLVDDRDGKPYLYDVNALSNFVADAVNVVGFDPFVRLVDYLEARQKDEGSAKTEASAVPASLFRRASESTAVEV